MASRSSEQWEWREVSSHWTAQWEEGKQRQGFFKDIMHSVYLSRLLKQDTSRNQNFPRNLTVAEGKS